MLLKELFETADQTEETVAKEVVKTFLRQPEANHLTRALDPEWDDGLLYVDIRDWGNWEVPEGEEDDGDYDWEVPTEKTAKAADALIKELNAKFPNFVIKHRFGEKNYINVDIKKKSSVSEDANVELRSLNDFKIEPFENRGEDGWFSVSVSSASGVEGKFIRSLASYIALKTKMELKLKSGLSYDFYKFKGNSFIVKSESLQQLKDVAEKQLKRFNVKQEREKLHKDSAPERKRQGSIYYSALRKEALKAYDEKYGKGTWGRVTFRQEGGDDGGSYVVRVDGQERWNGLTRRLAEYYKKVEVEKLAKKEKLGTFGNSK